MSDPPSSPPPNAQPAKAGASKRNPKKKAQRWILHADMDAFYASVEQRDDPSLQGKAVIIGAQSERGVVSAASYEARKFGVRSAMPGYKARELCPQGVFLAGDMKKYAEVSRQVHGIFRDFTDQIEPLALDEAFLDIGGSLGLFGSPLELGAQLKKRVKDEVGLVISVGIAPNKLVAKVACTRSKPDGLLLITREQVRKFLDPLPIRALWGIGPKAELRAKARGFHTIQQIADAPLHRLTPVFGEHAAAMQSRARGDDEREVISEREAKSIGEEATFSDNVTDQAQIISAITAHSETVAARARRSGFRGQVVQLKVKLAKRKSWGEKAVSSHELFPVLSRQSRLPDATADGMVIREAALNLWKKLALSEAVRLIGVTLSDLKKEEAPRQMDLFGALSGGGAHSPAVNKPGQTPTKARLSATRGEQLGHALDAISARFGDKAIGRGAGKLEKITASDKLKLGEHDQDE